MIHAGEILLCAKKVNAKTVKLIGDTQQIPYINRLPQYEVKNHDPNKFTICDEVLSVSYRCTQSTTLLLSQFYDQGMLVTSNVNNEMKRILFRNLQSIEFQEKDNVYLTFKQAEKDEISKHCKLNNFNIKIFTIHEYQGQQEKHVSVIRMMNRTEAIYDSKPHIIVALSRHTNSFTYYTPVSDDVLSKLVQNAISTPLDTLYH